MLFPASRLDRDLEAECGRRDACDLAHRNVTTFLHVNDSSLVRKLGRGEFDLETSPGCGIGIESVHKEGKVDKRKKNTTKHGEYKQHTRDIAPSEGRG